MYNSKLAVALKTHGKVLRELGENVYIPFGSEYSVFVKNLNTVRALVSVEIDGQDVGDGTQFIVQPNDSIDLERFVRAGNMNEGNRFKFIERTGAVEQHRGIGVEDGLIRVEFKFEKPYTPPYQPWNNGPYQTFDTFGGGSLCSTSFTSTVNHVASSNVRGAVASNSSGDAEAIGKAVMDWMETEPENDAGITVEGSISDQKFVQGAWFATEATTHAIVLKILGETEDNTPVLKPVYVKTKAKCKTCGHLNKASAKFCGECGTSLQLV